MTTDTQAAAQVDAAPDPDDPNDTVEARCKALQKLKKFTELYPPRVIEALHEGILRHIGDKLEEAGLKAESELIGNELFCLAWLSRITTDKSPTPKQAYEIMQFFGTHGLHETVAKATAIAMANDGWIVEL
jgi:hypothetical protein